MKGYFTVSKNDQEEFDILCQLRPNVVDDVPEEQSLLYAEIESTCNVINSNFP